MQLATCVWSSRVGARSTRLPHRLSNPSNRPPSASGYPGSAFSATPPARPPGDATRSSSGTAKANPIKSNSDWRLPQRQPKQHPHRQHPCNRWIRTQTEPPVDTAADHTTAATNNRLSTPSGYRERPTLDYTTLLNPIHRFRDRGRTARCSSQAGREERVSCWKPRTNLTGEPAVFQDPSDPFMQQRLELVKKPTRPCPSPS